jgi:DNA-binding protein Fis
MMNDANNDAGGQLCTLRELESRHIARVLELTGGNQRRAARALGITRWALARRLRKFGLGAPSSPWTASR